MKSYTGFLLLFILLASCKNKHKATRPIILDASYGRFSSYLIIGSDTQKVDSVYSRHFHKIFYRGYGNEDTLYTKSYIEKYYIPYDLEKEINSYVYNYFKPCVKCNLKEIYATEYHYIIATNPDGDSIQCCLYDQKNTLSFYYGLRKLIHKYHYFDHSHELTQNFGPMINIEDLFPNSKDSAKLLMNASEKDKKRYIETMKQKREKYKKQFEWAQKIDSIKTAIAKDHVKDKQVD